MTRGGESGAEYQRVAAAERPEGRRTGGRCDVDGAVLTALLHEHIVAGRIAVGRAAGDEFGPALFDPYERRRRRLAA